MGGWDSFGVCHRLRLVSALDVSSTHRRVTAILLACGTRTDVGISTRCRRKLLGRIVVFFSRTIFRVRTRSSGRRWKVVPATECSVRVILRVCHLSIDRGGVCDGFATSSQQYDSSNNSRRITSGNWNGRIHTTQHTQPRNNANDNTPHTPGIARNRAESQWKSQADARASAPFSWKAFSEKVPESEAQRAAAEQDKFRRYLGAD